MSFDVILFGGPLRAEAIRAEAMGPAEVKLKFD